MKHFLHAALSITVLLAASPAAAQKVQITKGPYLQWATAGSVHVVWDQDQAAATEVHYGPTSAMQLTAPSVSGTHHEVQLSGLQPGTTYDYAIYQGPQKLSADLTLPAPAAPTGSFRFLAFGDTRSDPVAHQSLIYAMALEPNVGLFVNTGDLVATGDDPSLWNTFFQVEAPLVGHVPLFPVIGNHDEADGDAKLFFQHFVLKSSSPEPEAFYSFDYGNSHFVVLDGHVNVDPWYLCILAGKLYDDCFKPTQLTWLQQDLQSASANPAIEHIFVFVHYGPYSSKENRTGNQQMRDLLPLFKTHGVTMIISGHDHYYERGVADNGIPYVVTGGGGAPLYAIDVPCPAPHTVIFNKTIYHYVVIDVTGLQVKLQTKTPDGTLLDQVTLVKPSPPAPDGGPPTPDGPLPLLDATQPGQPSDGPAAESPVPDTTAHSPPEPPPQDAGEAGCSCAMGRRRGLVGPVLWLLLLAGLVIRRVRAG